MDRSEITGTLISLEFGQGGRITQLWASDPTMPEDSDEFQFILGPVSFGEEFSEDYYPGAILIGARTTPEEPWIVSRAGNAELIEDEEGNVVQFEYDFPLLPEIRATGKFYESTGTVVPQICWDVRIANRGRVAIEIGELAFPFAFYNFMQGASRDEKDGRNPYQDRVTIHKFIGGSASYLHATRMSNEAPGLLIFPGDDTSWEMYTHVPRTLTSHYHWEGIPVAYVFSRASVEREGWTANTADHTSLILEPGDSRTFQTRFVPTSPTMGDAVFHTLSACGKPAMRVLPAAVAPANVGIAVEIGGVMPKKFAVNRDAELETDSDENGGFCFVRPKQPGPIRLQYDDATGQRTDVNLLFVEPINTLIQKRAAWICEHQLHQDSGTALDHAILLTNIRTLERAATPEQYATPFALESGLADALFLAEKNSIYPDEGQIKVLEDFVQKFLWDDVQNPGDGSVGCVFADFQSVALNYGRARTYPLVFNLLHAMYRVARTYGATTISADRYLEETARTAMAFFRVARRHESGGMPGFYRLKSIVVDLLREGKNDVASGLHSLLIERCREILRHPVTDNQDLTGDSYRFEELYWAADILGEESIQELALNYAFTLRDLGPNWWSYGSDYRILPETDGVPFDAVTDKGQIMLGHSTVANSAVYFDYLNRDRSTIDDVKMRLAFGGMMGVWALIRPDGAASMGYCPDAASASYGANVLTGDIGMSLATYLHRVRSVVLPSRNMGVFTFGCHFEVDAESYFVQPWDGVGRRISMRQIGFDAGSDGAKIIDLQLDLRKRWVKVKLENPSAYTAQASFWLHGLWGSKLEGPNGVVSTADGSAEFPLVMSPWSKIEIEIKVVQ